MSQKPEEETYARKEHEHVRSKHLTTHHDPSVEENRNFGATEIKHMELANILTASELLTRIVWV